MKPLFPLLFAFAALAPSTAAAQDIETINQGAPSGYVKGAGSCSGPFFVSRDGVLYASIAGQPVGPAEKGLQIIVYDDFTTRTVIVE